VIDLKIRSTKNRADFSYRTLEPSLSKALERSTITAGEDSSQTDQVLRLAADFFRVVRQNSAQHSAPAKLRGSCGNQIKLPAFADQDVATWRAPFRSA
jgi:hypothetical protein